MDEPEYLTDSRGSGLHVGCHVRITWLHFLLLLVSAHEGKSAEDPDLALERAPASNPGAPTSQPSRQRPRSCPSGWPPGEGILCQMEQYVLLALLLGFRVTGKHLQLPSDMDGCCVLFLQACLISKYHEFLCQYVTHQICVCGHLAFLLHVLLSIWRCAY